MSPFHGKLDIWTSQCSEQPHPFHGKLDTRTSHCSEQPSTGNWTNGHLSVANGFQLYIYRDYACNISSFPALTNPPSLSPESQLCNYLSLLMLKSARERLSFLSLAAAAASRVMMMMSGRNDVTRSVTNSGILGVRAPLPHPSSLPSYPFMFPSRSEKDL